MVLLLGRMRIVHNLVCVCACACVRVYIYICVCVCVCVCVYIYIYIEFGFQSSVCCIIVNFNSSNLFPWETLLIFPYIWTCWEIYWSAKLTDEDVVFIFGLSLNIRYIGVGQVMVHNCMLNLLLFLSFFPPIWQICASVFARYSATNLNTRINTTMKLGSYG